MKNDTYQDRAEAYADAWFNANDPTCNKSTEVHRYYVAKHEGMREDTFLEGFDKLSDALEDRAMRQYNDPKNIYLIYQIDCEVGWMLIDFGIRVDAECPEDVDFLF